jgi:hypothetical protein
MEFLPPASPDEVIAVKAGQPAAAAGRDLTRVPVRPEHLTGT